jgi:hypothetical protein
VSDDDTHLAHMLGMAFALQHPETARDILDHVARAYQWGASQDTDHSLGIIVCAPKGSRPPVLVVYTPQHDQDKNEGLREVIEALTELLHEEAAKEQN